MTADELAGIVAGYAKNGSAPGQTRRLDGECDLPYLPAWLVEDRVVEHYQTLELPDKVAENILTQVDDAHRHEQESIDALETSLNKRLADLDARENRILGLAEQGLPTDKLRQRLSDLRADRQRIAAEQHHASNQLSQGAAALKATTRLLHNIPALYQDVTDEIRGLINDAIYSQFWLDEDDVDADLRPPFDEIAVLRLRDVLVPEPSMRSGSSSRTRMTAPLSFTTGLSRTPTAAYRGRDPAGRAGPG